MGADGRGDAIGVGQRDRVIECARPDAAGGDRMAIKRGDQRQLLTAGGAVAIGKTGGVLPNSLDARVSGDIGGEGVQVQVMGAVGHGPHCRTRLGRLFEACSNM